MLVIYNNKYPLSIVLTSFQHNIVLNFGCGKEDNNLRGPDIIDDRLTGKKRPIIDAK